VTVDLIVVGGGITGCEAAYAAARAGLGTLLVTTSLDTLYVMAHDEYELQPPPGSLMEACLGDSRGGPVMADAVELRRQAKRLLEAEPGLHLLQSTASALLVDGSRVTGVATWEGVDRAGGNVALCVGSFLGARLTVGSSVEHAGRLSEMAYADLEEDLLARGFRFEAGSLRLEALGGALPYEVGFDVFAGAEWSPDTYRLGRLEGLYAAGACVGRLGYETAALQGMTLARAVMRHAVP
jgi:tRNA U34 5-carboxymethylaminomethyl modifying enzyme MnmG/GidA